MPRRRYGDGVREEALRLRGEGYSYREISRIIGCSVYKAYELVNGRRIDELYSRIEDLCRRIVDIEEEMRKLEAREAKGGVESGMKEIKDRLNDVARRINEIESRSRGMEGEVSRLRGELNDVRDDVNMIRIASTLRSGCRWIDGDGYCRAWRWIERIEGIDMRVESINGKTIYRINVGKYPLLCIACPAYSSPTG